MLASPYRREIPFFYLILRPSQYTVILTPGALPTTNMLDDLVEGSGDCLEKHAELGLAANFLPPSVSRALNPFMPC